MKVYVVICEIYDSVYDEFREGVDGMFATKSLAIDYIKKIDIADYMQERLTDPGAIKDVWVNGITRNFKYYCDWVAFSVEEHEVIEEGP